MSFDFTNISSNLAKKGYKVQIFNTKLEAAEYLDKQINGEIVGMGGSLTIHQMELYPMLA